jgi:hypothetical protein
MRLLRSASMCNRLRHVVLSSGLVLLFATSALAGPVKDVRVEGTGGVTGQGWCSDASALLKTTVTGTATHIGRFVGALSECIDITNGSYSGTGVFTTPDGSTILTEYTGQQTPPDQNGKVFFAETHQIVGGTGKYAGASGELEVVGVADAASGRFRMSAVGTLSN